MAMIKVLAVLCSISSPDICMQKLVMTSDLSNVTMLGCQAGMPELADWLKQYPLCKRLAEVLESTAMAIEGIAKSVKDFP